MRNTLSSIGFSALLGAVPAHSQAAGEAKIIPGAISVSSDTTTSGNVNLLISALAKQISLAASVTPSVGGFVSANKFFVLSSDLNSDFTSIEISPLFGDQFLDDRVVIKSDKQSFSITDKSLGEISCRNPQQSIGDVNHWSCVNGSEKFDIDANAAQRLTGQYGVLRGMEERVRDLILRENLKDTNTVPKPQNAQAAPAPASMTLGEVSDKN